MPFGHRHKNQEEIYVVVSGSLRAKLEDEVVELMQWDAIRVPKETMRLANEIADARGWKAAVEETVPTGSLQQYICDPTRADFQEQLLDFFVRIDSHVSRQQALAIPESGIHNGIIDAFEIEQGSVPLYLGIEGRLPVGKHN